MADYGVKISLPNTNVITAAGQNITFNSKNPLMKIDTQNPVGFQTLNFVFLTDPPENATTIVYQFPHGYAYTPSIEALFYMTSPPSVNFFQTYFQDVGVISSHSAFDSAQMYATVYNANIYLIVTKAYFGLGSPNNLVGIGLEITIHVFVDDLSGT